MPATILDGNKIAAEIRAEAAAEVKAMAAAGLRPGLAVVLVGNNPASEIYVRGKVKSCEELGIYGEQHTPSANVTTEELLELVADVQAVPRPVLLCQTCGPFPPVADVERLVPPQQYS